MRIPILNYIAVTIGLAAMTGCTRIKPDEIGVLTQNIGGGEGIVKQDFIPGYHRNLWPFHTWHRFPSTVQLIRFGKDSAGDPLTMGGEPLQITSTDGDHVVMTADVLYRIKEGEAHRILQEIGADQRYREFVRGLAQDATRVLFGKLHTEAFYTEESRETVRREAVTLLTNRLKERGIELIDLLVEGVEFDQNYENLIKLKKLADQRVELERARSKAAGERGKVSKIVAESAVKIAKMEREAEIEIARRNTELSLQIGGLKAEAEKYSVSIIADAGLVKSQSEAEGQKLLKQAEADGTRRMNDALAGDGGHNYIALEAAKKINISEVAFPSSGFDWFNPAEIAERLGAVKKADKDADQKKK